MSSSSSRVAPGLRRLHLLVVDDCDADLELTREALMTLNGHLQVTTARSWREVPPSVWTGRLDLIMVDAHMPGVDGFAVLRQLKADPARRVIPVIVRSGSDAPGDVARAYADGASAYVRKPSGFDGLVAQLHALLAFWQLNRTPADVTIPR